MNPALRHPSRYATFLRWMKFNAVGWAGIVVQLATLSLLTRVLALHYLAATALAVEAAVLHNFFWHERFTWSDRAHIVRRERFSRFLKFNLTAGLVSIAGNLVLMRLLVGIVHLNYLAANMTTIAICSLANFVVSDRFVFALQSSAGERASHV
jgi:putative flippase GtrA